MMTLEEATEQLNSAPFPELVEGDVVWWPGKTLAEPNLLGYKFTYVNGEWVYSGESIVDGN
jgi:hypothetical protein